MAVGIVYGMIVIPLSCSPHAARIQRQVNAITEHHPTFFLAAAVAVIAAVALQLIGVPAPWPAALALYIYGLVAWPVLRERLPVPPTMYAVAWVSVALLVVVYETLAP